MKYRGFFIAGLGTAKWIASSLALQLRCRPLYGEQSGEKNTLCVVWISVMIWEAVLGFWR